MLRNFKEDSVVPPHVPYKLSYYLIKKHVTFHDVDLMLVFSTRSGAFKVFKMGLWVRISNLKLDAIADEIINDLYASKILVAHDEDELDLILEENKKSNEDTSDFYAVIQPTAACPLGCGYCGQAHSSKNMSEQKQKDLIERYRKQIFSGNYKSISIGWFGAEPLVAFKVIENLSYELQKIARNKGIPYSAKVVTNGLLLTKEISKKLIEDHKINSIEFTLDGVKEFHDSRRHLKTGGATFDKIYNNLLDLVNVSEGRIDISVRCNTDNRNKDGISPLIRQMSEDGLSDKVRVYFAQIHSWGNDAHLLAASKEDFSSWEIDWLIELAEYGFKTRLLPSRNKNLCIAVSKESELIDPFGNVFSCTEVSLVPSYEENGENTYALGNISNAYLEKNSRRDSLGNFYNKEVIAKYDCYTCRMLPTCGGACPKSWAEGNMPCPPTKNNISERMVLELLRNKEEIEKIFVS